MRFKYAAQQGLKPGSDMTPMIDIIFNLLLFFILSSSYVQNTALEIRLPETTSAANFEGEAIVVELRQDESLLFQSKQVTFDELRQEMRAVYPEPGSTRPLLIRADLNAKHGHVVAILDLAREFGVSSLNVATIPVERR